MVCVLLLHIQFTSYEKELTREGSCTKWVEECAELCFAKTFNITLPALAILDRNMRRTKRSCLRLRTCKTCT